jgi:predicted nucleotidyltransferase
MAEGRRWVGGMKGPGGRGRPLRPRDFVGDAGGWIYSVSAYDNAERAGCVLRYVPDPSGERVSPEGARYRKVDFEESFILAGEERPSWVGEILRIPLREIARVYKPDERLAFCTARDRRVGELADLFSLPAGSLGCTGSRLLGLEGPSSDIDLVVYGHDFFRAREILREAIGDGRVAGLSLEMWRTVYAKREPEIPFPVFLLHEQRKWNRGEIGGTYFDLLYTRSYDDLEAAGREKDHRGPGHRCLPFLRYPGELPGGPRRGEPGPLLHPHVQRAGPRWRDRGGPGDARGARRRALARGGHHEDCPGRVHPLEDPARGTGMRSRAGVPSLFKP